MAINEFLSRHIGLGEKDIQKALDAVGEPALENLMDKIIPDEIRLKKQGNGKSPMSEHQYLKLIGEIASRNKIFKTYIGQGYYNTITPSVIMRNIFENPGWYTSYTPYQAEISQGRLEAMLNFQTMVTELTGMEIANASLLDEATAVAEAILMLYNNRPRQAVKNGANVFFVDENMFKQTLKVVKTRIEPFNIQLETGKAEDFEFTGQVFGCCVQYPGSNGQVNDYSTLVEKAHEVGCAVVVAADILALSLLKAPGHWGADVVVGSTQRFGIPMGYGGPHAAFFATREQYKRHIPGRIIGVSVDAHGNKALRMALQTREQHIKRERATSNICTAQALLASMAGMYAVYHGPDGIRSIAKGIHQHARALSDRLKTVGLEHCTNNYFDTLCIQLPGGDQNSTVLQKIALEHEINFFFPGDEKVLISLDETTTIEDVNAILEVFEVFLIKAIPRLSEVNNEIALDKKLLRTDEYLVQEVFHKYRTETEMMRYIKRLENKDISLTRSMIPLGSCTMKLNAATELMPLSMPALLNIHPFVPLAQVEGYHQLIHDLGMDLLDVTGFEGISFQPNSGANGEYTGLLMIRQYHQKNGEDQRNIILIPSSAHGTNPASGVMAGMKVVVIDCDENGNIDVDDLKEKAAVHANELAGIMITYPSTHGVYENRVKEITSIVHEHGGQVYMDGANMNAQVGLTSPMEIGADVCHLNLHKTFAIPHGGGGPGVGPVCVADHLIEFLPTHPMVETGGTSSTITVAAAPFGSASILAISYAYCKLLGQEGMKEASRVAILNANYLAAKIKNHYDVLYTGQNGYVAHEMILDCRKFREFGISETDIAKRLMDYGFHAPTLSFPVAGTLMVEPTESESLAELDRFVEAMLSIHDEIEEVRTGKADPVDNVLKNAPHTAATVTSSEWKHPYSREKAAYPVNKLRADKYWPPVGRLNDAHGDRNLVCTCGTVEDYA